MNHFNASIVREGKWWMVRVDGVPGLTQARRLSEAEPMAREFVAASLDVAIDQVRMRVTIAPIKGLDGLAERLEQVASDRARAAELEAAAAREATAIARELADRDVPVRDVGTLLGISHQRAHQLIAAR